MTYRNRTSKSWPPVPERRRTVIESRTALGQPCTLIVERQADGPLIVSFHGGIRATAAPCPKEAAQLIEALQAAAAGGAR